MPLSLRENICESHRLPRDEEVLAGRMELLEPKDKELLEAVIINGQPTRLIASLMNKSPQHIRNRVYRLSRRLASRRFLDAARAMPYLSPADAQLAKLHFCQGVAQRQLARQTGMTIHAVRRSLDRLAAAIATIRSMSKTAERKISQFISQRRQDDSQELAV
ncbi:MAG: hypothetical protein HZA50_00490 [Planctomycetes bacterium]|nr:hypothetical protein [Planctomycetota bacterium]